MSALPITIRDAHVADLPVMQSLYVELGYDVELATLAARFTQFTASGERALVVERDGVVLGLATLHVTPVLHRAGPVGRVTALIVTASARGTGAGAALMRAAESLLADRGCVLMEVTSNRTRTDAHTFYERIGYTATSYRFAKTLDPTVSSPTSPTPESVR
jgi:GNAT superfamily N-acetyltransferase